MKQFRGYVLSTLIVLAAIVAAAIMYSDYVTNPWTRDGQVRARVVQVASRVSGPIVQLPIRDNQQVAAGDLLFEIDRRTFEADLAGAQAKYDKTKDDLAALAQQVAAAEAGVEQYRSAISQAQSRLDGATAKLEEAEANRERSRILFEKENIAKMRLESVERNYLVDLATKEQSDAILLSSKSALLQSEANLAKAKADLGAPGEENARLRAAKAALNNAKLNLDFTRVVATVDGFVTNLELQLGSQVVVNQPTLALIDSSSFWIDAYFRETQIAEIRPGQEAVVTLMSNPDLPLLGTVNSIGRGIAKADGSTGSDLLPNVSPTFEWIRLAQRIPVRIELGKLPQDISLRVGATASVMVRTKGATGELTPAPKMLQ
jgi:multidrug resistance efflux pump